MKYIHKNMAFTIPKDFSNFPKMIRILFFHPWLSSKKANVVFSDIQVDYFLPLSKSASLRRIIVTLVVEKIALKIDLRAYHKKPSKLIEWLGKMCATPGWFSYEDNGKKSESLLLKLGILLLKNLFYIHTHKQLFLEPIHRVGHKSLSQFHSNCL